MSAASIAMSLPMPTRPALRAFAAASLSILTLSAATAEETRCGWLYNPTPANWWLVDNAGEWVIGLQGGYQAGGDIGFPEVDETEWVATNGYYGYGCACLSVETDPVQKRITYVYSSRQIALDRCRQDPSLPAE